ncbi:MAG: hypothetical protein A2259_04920 [Candidatus Moranbacteria bacterium RIFOXYA2_FULL_43_15]|nr:MAG: hypothetical protein A2259_04920 [Candidatus Moranbacteria bacterium RIFOXYA2_FULL_43_15]
MLVIAAVIIGAGYYFFFGGKKDFSGSRVVDSSKYQAVFLTNGQVYFGKVSNENSDYVSVSDVYYMVLKKPLQNQQRDGEEQNQDQAKPEYTLVKLGKEMHGPTSMSVNRDQILFVENLADDSKVVSTIKGGGKQ